MSDFDFNNNIFEELSPAGNDLRFKTGHASENPDKLISQKGYEYIESLERDTHLSAMLSIRRQKLIEKGWEIKPFVSKNGKVTARNQYIRDFIAYTLDEMAGSFEKDIESMLDCIGKGFSLSEMTYKPILSGKFAGKIGLRFIRHKPARYFSFKFDNHGHYQIRQIDPDAGGKPLPLNKFVHLINGNDENPYGESLSSKSAFWVWLKKNQTKFWAIFNERFGMPLTVVKVPKNVIKGDEQHKVALEIIRDLATKSGITVPENFEMSFLEPQRRGDITYDNFIERSNKEISKIILGATLISEEGKRGQGSYALSSTHEGVLETYTIFDSHIVAQAINEQIIKPLINFNFITEEMPFFSWSGMSISGMISFAQSIGILADKGMNIPISWIHEQSGIPIAKEGEPTLRGSQSAVQGSNNGVIGVDNRASGSFLESSGINFDDLPEEIAQEALEAELIVKRYQLAANQIQKQAIGNIKTALKKKALTDPDRS